MKFTLKVCSSHLDVVDAHAQGSKPRRINSLYDRSPFYRGRFALHPVKPSGRHGGRRC